MSAEAPRYRLGIDTGGTFTDVVAIDERTGTLAITKTPSTPSDPSRGLLDGIRKVLHQIGASPDLVATVAHGTTIATNALLEERFTSLGLLVTRSFRHTLEREIATGKPDATAAYKGIRDVYFEGLPLRPAEAEPGRDSGVAGRNTETTGAFQPCPLYDRAGLLAGNHIVGPAIIEEYGSTTVIFPGQQAEVDRYGNLLLNS